MSLKNEDVPENDEWTLEDAVYNSLANKKPIKYPCGPYRTYCCGLDFNPPKYKEDCYFYSETHDMGAIIRFCTRGEIEWGYCPCEKCDRFLSNEEADKIVRSQCRRNRKRLE